MFSTTLVIKYKLTTSIYEIIVCKFSLKNFNSCILLCILCRHIIERACLNCVSLSKMDLNVYIQLILLCVVNIIFTFSGIISNTLVIVSTWKSSQLRKKLCHFMIMVLSSFDLVAVITNQPGILLYLILWLREDYDSLSIWWTYLELVLVFLGFSFSALLVMSIERYMGAYYPIFHRTSVTRRRLITFLAILLNFQITLHVISANDIIIPRPLSITIFSSAIFPPLLYVNIKLFKISKEVRRRNATSPEKRTTINLKSISTCSLVVACLVVLSIPASVYTAFNIIVTNRQGSSARLSRIWATTIFTINGTFNSLIFFWKNNILRTEGINTLMTLKERLVGS